MKEKILIIIPAYNEADNIKKTYNSIIKYNKENKTKYDVIVINDGSIDDTENKLIKNNIPHISLIQNLGIGGAVQTGYKYAYLNDYDIAVQFDGDGQHDVGYIDNVIAPIINDKADVVIGSRFVNDEKNNGEFRSTGMRRAGIKWLSGVIRFLTGKRVYDVTSGFRATDKKYTSYFASSYSADYPEPEAIVAAAEMGAHIAEVPVVMHERTSGKSSIGFWSSGYYMIKVTLSLFISRLSFGFRR